MSWVPVAFVKYKLLIVDEPEMTIWVPVAVTKNKLDEEARVVA